MKVDSELQKPGEARVTDGGGGSYGDESKTIVTESCTWAVEEMATALTVKNVNSMVLTHFTHMVPTHLEDDLDFFFLHHEFK